MYLTDSFSFSNKKNQNKNIQNIIILFWEILKLAMLTCVEITLKNI